MTSEFPPGPRASRSERPEPEAVTTADVVVVGAGPGGSTAATFMARQGLDVVLVEKSDFPREKVCGDGLTPRAVRMMTRIGIDTSTEAGWRHSKGLRIHAGHHEPLDMPWPTMAEFPEYGLVCPRDRFDDLLAGIAVEAGAHLFTGVRITEPIFHERHGRIIGVRDNKGREFRAPVVVAADGVSARVALQAGRDRIESRPMGVAVRSYYTSPKSDLEWIESFLTLWDGKPGESNLLPGYGWMFPVGDGSANVGLGILNSSSAFGKTDYRELMRRWLDNTPEEWGFREENRLVPIRGAALPMAFNRKPLYADGLLLVGDSAGMTSPFNGEGISYAMEAGEMAADAVADAHGRGYGTPGAELALRSYASRIEHEWGGYYRLGTIFSRLIGNPTIMNLCTTYGIPRKRLMFFVHKLLAHLNASRPETIDDVIINTLAKIAPSA